MFTDRNRRDPFYIDYRERGFHAQGVYPTQDISRMRTARAKQEANARIVKKYMEESNVGTKRKSPELGQTRAIDLTKMILEGRDSTYHRSD